MSVEKKMLTFWEMNILSSKIEETFRVTDCEAICLQFGTKSNNAELG